MGILSRETLRELPEEEILANLRPLPNVVDREVDVAAVVEIHRAGTHKPTEKVPYEDPQDPSGRIARILEHLDDNRLPANRIVEQLDGGVNWRWELWRALQGKEEERIKEYTLRIDADFRALIDILASAGNSKAEMPIAAYEFDEPIVSQALTCLRKDYKDRGLGARTRTEPFRPNPGAPDRSFTPVRLHFLTLNW